MPSFRLALAQVNPTVGALAENARRIAGAAKSARRARADLVVFPEMALSGYPPEDLLFEPLFIKECAAALVRLAREIPQDLVALVGLPTGKPGDLRNSAAVLYGGKARAFYHKWRLPNYGVFDEKRYFLEGHAPVIFSVGGTTVGVTICEDIWVAKGPALAAAKGGASLVVNLSASPFHVQKLGLRRQILRRKALECRLPLAYCNMIGGQDELVYDGGSLVVDAKGKVLAQAPQFEEHVLTFDLDLPRRKAKLALPGRAETRPPAPALRPAVLSREEEIYSALVLGTRDYVRKNGFGKAVVGLSGGIDSSLVACIAVDALGKENVVGITMPSRFNAAETKKDAEVLAKNLGIAFHSLPIEDIAQAYGKALAPLFAGRAADITEENLQSRVRGTLLMAASNKFGWLVLTTGNKSETSAGFFTLYGDSAGGFAVIKDVPKTWVFELARWRNTRGPAIPESVITRPPTAELRENQKDEDSLPPYDLLDRALQLYVEDSRGLADLVKSGIEPATAKKILRLVDLAEYKRRQAPPGVKITPRAFGRDRRMPITNGFKPYDR